MQPGAAQMHPRLACALVLAGALPLVAFGPIPVPLAPRTPFAFGVGGGGFATMTGGMGFARALSDAFEEAGTEDGWQTVTHISGNSGGQWFQVQFAFSSVFHANLTAPKLSPERRDMSTLLGEWAVEWRKHAAAHLVEHTPIGDLNVSSRLADLANPLHTIVQIIADLTCGAYSLTHWALVGAGCNALETLTHTPLSWRALRSAA